VHCATPNPNPIVARTVHPNPLSQAQAKFPAVKPSFLELYLFTSAYFYALLTHGYGFDLLQDPVYYHIRTYV